MPAVTLDQVAAAYRRAQRAVARNMEDALEFMNGERFSALELDQNIIDAAFFVLIFGQLENRINLLVERTQDTDERKIAIRGSKFEQRIKIALPNRPDLREELEDWYSIRSHPAHGSGIASGYDIAAVLDRARQLGDLLDEIG